MLAILWSNLDARTITNYFLYGTAQPAADYEDRLRPNGQNPTLDIQLNDSYFSSGPGQYAHIARNSAVHDFFNMSGNFTGLSDGTYTVATLKSSYGFVDADFKYSLQQVNTDLGNNNWLERTYIYNTQQYIIQDDVEFVISGGGTLCLTR